MLDKVINKIRKCGTYASLYCLEEDLNGVGLTLQATAQNKMVICKIVDNRPLADKILEDYIYVGSTPDRDREIGLAMVEAIIEFVQEAAGDPAEVVDIGRSWQNTTQFYAEFDSVQANGDVIAVAEQKQEVVTEGVIQDVLDDMSVNFGYDPMVASVSDDLDVEIEDDPFVNSVVDSI